MSSPSRAIRRPLVVVALLVSLAAAAGPGRTTTGRVAWTTSRVVGSPDPPPPYQVVRAFPRLKFDHPLLMARPPKGDRLFVGEQAGVLYSFLDRPDARAELFLDLRTELKTVRRLADAKEVESVYGLAFHPRFESNHQCFICYTLRAGDGRANLKDGTRVSRFTVRPGDPPRVDPASEEILLTFLQGGHNGGDLHFGPDGMLYISTGDAASPNPPDPLNTGQDVADLLSSILRIDVDRKDAGKNYAVPRDNPFVRLKGAAPEVWAYGFRNPWRMAFDAPTGALYVGDVGWELWESVHRVEKGGNYGWAAMEGPQPIKPEKVGPTPISPPLIQLSHAVGCSVTGGRVYRGQKFPELRGAYVFGDWETRRLWAARFEGGRTVAMPEITRPTVRVVAFGESSRRRVAFLDYDAGTVHTLERNTAAAQRRFPDEAVGYRIIRVGAGPPAGGRGDAVHARQPAVAGRGDGRAPARSAGSIGGHPAPGARQAGSGPGQLAQLSAAFPEGRGAGPYSVAGRPARGDAAFALRRPGLAGVHLRLGADGSDADLVPADGRRPRGADRRQGRGEADVGVSAAASACRATTTSRSTRWRSCPSNELAGAGRPNRLAALTEAGYVRRSRRRGPAAAAVRRRRDSA
ncbi:MAG: PQQ-dependent sugar dehydrogenase [Gemmataceae bacterium]